MAIPNVAESVQDAGLAKIATADRATFCSAEPTSLAELATNGSGFGLATVALTGGDWTIGAGTGTARRITLAAKSGVAVDDDGTGVCVAVDDGTEILAVFDYVDTAVVTGGTVDLGEVYHEDQQPANV